MIEEFISGFVAGLIMLALILMLKMPWIKIWGQHKQIVLSVDKSNKGIITVLPARLGQWGEAGNPAGRGTVQFNTTPIWIPALRQRWFLHYGEQCCTIEAQKAAFATHMKGLGKTKKDLGIGTPEILAKRGAQAPDPADPITELQNLADTQPSPQGIAFDLRDCRDYYAEAVNPEEIDALTDCAAIEKTGLRRVLEGSKKGFNWMMIIIIIFGAIAAFFVLPSILGMLGM